MKDLTAFKDLLLEVDPKATKYKGIGGDSYTVWTPYSIDKEMADNMQEDVVWSIQVDRFTKADNDPIAKAIYNKLTEAGIPFEYELDFEPDTGYIHHIYVCSY